MIRPAILMLVLALIFYPALWVVLLVLYAAVLASFSVALLFFATWGWFERRTLERHWRAERRA